jgi:hypothetical protein
MEKEDLEVIRMVCGNPRRSEMLMDVGIIVPLKEAEAFTAWQAAQKQKEGIRGLALAIAGLLVVVILTVIALI